MLTKAIVYFPTCHRFLRGDDASLKTDQQLRVLPSTSDRGRSRCGNVESCMPAQVHPNAFGGIIAQLMVGVLVNGIILLWMCEGTLGMFLNILSFEEVLLAFVLIPWYLMNA